MMTQSALNDPKVMVAKACDGKKAKKMRRKAKP